MTIPPDRWLADLASGEHVVEVDRGGWRNRYTWYVDGDLVAEKTTNDDHVVLTDETHGSIAVKAAKLVGLVAGSNSSTAPMRAMLPSWIRSFRSIPRGRYSPAMLATNRRLATTRSSRAWRSPSRTRDNNSRSCSAVRIEAGPSNSSRRAVFISLFLMNVMMP